MPEVRHVLSLGAGVNSVALMIKLVREGMPLDEAIFADTGSELPETYDYLPIAENFLAAHDIPLRRVQKPNGESLYETSWRRRVFPSAVWRWSTRDFKVNPIYRYYRSLGVPIVQYMGIASDEWHRMKDSRVDYVTNVYPLVDDAVTRDGCVEIIESEGLPVPPKSGCFFCPFNSLERWKWLDETHPHLYDKAIALEERSKHFPDQLLTDQVFREKASISLRKLRKSLRSGDAAHIRLEVMETPCGAECMT